MSSPVDMRHSPAARWRGLPLADVSVTGGFWAAWQQRNREVSLEHGHRMLEQAGNLSNLQLAAGTGSDGYRGPVFMDSDLYKWLEAVAYAAPAGLTPPVQEAADQIISLIQSAQAPDGYLDSYYQVVAPNARWQELNTGHELYCAGHLIQAAIALNRALGDHRLLTVARRVVEHISGIFGPGKRVGVPGHPEIEMALVELYRETRERAYMELAQFFVDHRGYSVLGPHPRHGSSAYYQDRVPIREATELEGHAVRALYLTTGATDVYLETGEHALLDAQLAQWNDFVSRKLYITGGAGSRHQGEAFGQPYELPTERAYWETCAAIASIMWNWRLLLATGRASFADVIERTLYNGFLAGVGLAGDAFFYVNPLMTRGQPEVLGRGFIQRQPWFTVACCPPNVMRLLASLGHYIASVADDGVQLHQYAPSLIRAPLADGSYVRMKVETEYPWDGRVAISIEEAPSKVWALKLRIPAWCATPRLRLNGTEIQPALGVNGYAAVHRRWYTGDCLDLTLSTTPRLTEPHPHIESTRGCVAIERGPLVYCVEQADHRSADVHDLALDVDLPLAEEWHPDLLGGVMTVTARGTAADLSGWSHSTFGPPSSATATRSERLTAIPYFAWANRQPGAMRVWIPKSMPGSAAGHPQ